MVQKIKLVKNPKGLKDGRSNYNMMKSLKNAKFLLAKRSKLIVADFELKTGDVEHFVVEVKNDSFTLFGGKYLVHESYLKYNRTFKMWVSKYHEGISLPIDQSIPSKDIVKAIKNSSDKEVQDIVNNINPSILESFVKSEIVQKVFAGEQMQNIFGFIKIMLILTVAGIGVCAFILIAGVV